MGFRGEGENPFFVNINKKENQMNRIKDGEKPLYFYRSIQKL